MVLNLADNSFPGGCVYTGSGAQEESIFRRTDVSQTLEMSFYPIRDAEAVYSPAVRVLKASEADDWRVIAGPSPVVATIACPGIYHPALDPSGSMSDEDLMRLHDKIELVLQIAHDKRHSSLVLGALGCGAWRCPPEQVASVFTRVLQRHPGAFERVVFAIIPPVDTGRRSPGLLSNFDAFAQAITEMTTRAPQMEGWREKRTKTTI